MSTCAFREAVLESPEVDSPVLPPPQANVPPVLSTDVKRHWIGGTSALAMAALIERSAGMLANILAARLGGASIFGSYSLAISTANNIGTYAAGGIGATATRFSGKYPFGSREYALLGKALGVVSLCSAVLASIALWAGAGPLAHLLGKPGLASLLRWASLSAGGMVLLECARGFFVGQRRVAALLVLSVLVGFGLLLTVPLAAHLHNPARMVNAQAMVCGGAVLLCLAFGRVLGLFSQAGAQGTSLWPMLCEVWSFGVVQLSGLISANLAGWWLTTLIARADTTLSQVAFFAIASQMRNLAGIVPSLLTEGSYAVMAAPLPEHLEPQGSAQHRVMALSSFGSLAAASVLACIGIIITPWMLHLLYGAGFAGADVAIAMALALSVVHMSNSVAAARLSIVSIRRTGIINTVWAGFVAVAATAFLLHGGLAWQGLAILLVAHLVSAALVLASLRRMDHLPRGMQTSYSAGVAVSVALAVLAIVRAHRHAHAAAVTAVMAACFLVYTAVLFYLGKRYHWLPSRAALVALHARVSSLLRRKEAVRV